MVHRISKIEAAERQLNSAVRLLFSGFDSVAIHTLVGAASIVLCDLAEISGKDGSWENKIAVDSGLTKREFFDLARRAQNFFKHARSDPDGVLEFDAQETEILLFIASLNWGELLTAAKSERKLSIEMSVFQLWFIASWHENWSEKEEAEEVWKVAYQWFPDFSSLNRDQKLAKGLSVLQAELREEAI
ncbi:hypothetical protein [Woeseia oceani]|nr:hypothetical protein [Woeseia oceani]